MMLLDNRLNISKYSVTQPRRKLLKQLTESVNNDNIYLNYFLIDLILNLNFKKRGIIYMLSIVKSMSLQGLNGFLVDVQVDVSAGMPNFEVVGLPDATVRESKERVRTSIKNSGFKFPSRKILINLAPADTRKEGSFFDLPIAIGILLDFQEIQPQNLDSTVFIGELSLDGTINKINGVLPMCIEAKKLGIKRVVLPKDNAKEAAIVSDLQVIGANTLKDVVDYLNQNLEIEPTKANMQNLFNKQHKYCLNFSEVKGQENVKRALEVAAARWS